MSDAIDFGPLAAQGDPQLLSYFCKTPQISRLTDPLRSGPSKFIVVSRPGAGKSAIFKFVKSQNSGFPAFVIQGAERVIFPHDDQTMSLDLCRSLAFGELAAAFISWARASLPLSIAVKRQIQIFQAKQGFKKIFTKAGREIVGLNILGTGFSLAPRDRSQYLEVLRSSAFTDEAKRLIKLLADQSPSPAIVVDDPEYMVVHGLTEVSKENSIKLGALLEGLERIDSVGVRTPTFIREHIHRAVLDHYTDASHYADRVTGLGWTSDSLLDLLHERLKHRLKREWSDVFPLEKQQFSEQVFPFLVNGPRDLLYICNLAGENLPINEASLLKAIKESQRGQWLELKRQFDTSFPGFQKFAIASARMIVQNFGLKEFDPAGFDDLIDNGLTRVGSDIYDLRGQNEWVDELAHTPRRAAELLYAAGCLGYARDGERIYPWAGRSNEGFSMADRYFLSKAFSEQ